jgi:hypothetical protein
MAVLRSASVLAVFLTMSLLWSLWVSPSVADWAGLVRGVDWNNWVSWSRAVGILVVCVLIGSAGVMLMSHGFLRELVTATPTRWGIVTSVVVLLLLTGFSIPSVPQYADRTDVLGTLRQPQLRSADEAAHTMGYYEELTLTRDITSPVWSMDQRRPPGWNSLGPGGSIRVPGLLRRELSPNLEIVHRGASFRTNRWGMRDRDYALEKDSITFRVAILGSSYEMGAGVNQEEVFENLVENELNRHVQAKSPRVELLNFAMGGYKFLEMVPLLEGKALRFNPDAVYLFMHPGGTPIRMASELADAYKEVDDLGYDFLVNLFDSLDIARTQPSSFMLKSLEPSAFKVAAWLYQTIAADCREAGCRPVWIYVPNVKSGPMTTDLKEHARLATAAGFDVINLDGLYNGVPREDLQVAPWDDHPNALGHRMLADALLKEVLELHPELQGYR